MALRTGPSLRVLAALVLAPLCHALFQGGGLTILSQNNLDGRCPSYQPRNLDALANSGQPCRVMARPRFSSTSPLHFWLRKFHAPCSERNSGTRIESPWPPARLIRHSPTCPSPVSSPRRSNTGSRPRGPKPSAAAPSTLRATQSPRPTAPASCPSCAPRAHRSPTRHSPTTGRLGASRRPWATRRS